MLPPRIHENNCKSSNELLMNLCTTLRSSQIITHFNLRGLENMKKFEVNCKRTRVMGLHRIALGIANRDSNITPSHKAWTIFTVTGASESVRFAMALPKILSRIDVEWLILDSATNLPPEFWALSSKIAGSFKSRLEVRREWSSMLNFLSESSEFTDNFTIWSFFFRIEACKLLCSSWSHELISRELCLSKLWQIPFWASDLASNRISSVSCFPIC